MTATVDQLVRDLGSADADTRALALAGLVAQGAASTTALIEAFDGGDAELRRLAVQALAEIADPRAAPTLARAVADSDEQVRARGAQGLAALGDPRALDALVTTIDDLEDPLEQPHTLATQLLIGLGPGGLPAVAPLLRSPNPMTRQHAFLVVRSVTERLPDVPDWTRLWQSLGRYDPVHPDAASSSAAEQWIDWIQRRDTPPPPPTAG